MRGYLHRLYAESLSDFGHPIKLSHSGGWVLKRRIPGFSCWDLMGCYPLFLCLDWSQLNTDLEEMRDEYVTLALVTDPFGEYTPHDLKKTFNAGVNPFKDHYVVDLSLSQETFISKHHKRNAMKALKTIEIEICDEPHANLDEWIMLYNHLIHRHQIKGLQAFSRKAFLSQLKIPGITLFRALFDGQVVSMQIWYEHSNLAYYHLGASSSLGYEQKAGFALFWFIIDYFRARGLKWLNLGSGAGTKHEKQDGLSRFKSGWASGTKTAYFCSSILDIEEYNRIIHEKGLTISSYFPAYRYGEFR